MHKRSWSYGSTANQRHLCFDITVTAHNEGWSKQRQFTRGMPVYCLHQRSWHMTHISPHDTIVETSVLDRSHSWSWWEHQEPLGHSRWDPPRMTACAAYLLVDLDSNNNNNNNKPLLKSSWQTAACYNDTPNKLPRRTALHCITEHNALACSPSI